MRAAVITYCCAVANSRQQTDSWNYSLRFCSGIALPVRRLLRGRCSCRRRRWRRRLVRINPARLDPAIQAVGGLRIDAALVQDQTAKRRLNMTSRTAKSVIKIEMAERGVDVVAPEQADHAPAKPDAFGVPRRAGNRALDRGVFVGRLRCRWLSLTGCLFDGLSIWSLGEGRGAQRSRDRKERHRDKKSASNAGRITRHDPTWFAVREPPSNIFLVRQLRRECDR